MVLIKSCTHLLLAPPSSIMVERSLSFYKSIPRAVIDTILHTSSSVKSIILLTLLLLCSLVYSFELFQSPYFGNKRNFLNRNFAKLGWGWTLSCILPVTLITSALYSGLHLGMVLKHLSRIVIAHCMFFGVTTAIVTCSTTWSSFFGHCSNSQYTNRVDCSSNSEKWIEFDISGHTFLLAYCIFVLTEECKLIKPSVWGSYKNALANNKPQHSARINEENSMIESRNDLLLKVHMFTTPAIKLLEVVACLEVLLMGNLFVATQMYYHTFFEKVLGFFLAVACWMVTYVLWYGKACGPYAVTDGPLNPLNIDL